jgi:signal transduction histidine kinase
MVFVAAAAPILWSCREWIQQSQRSDQERLNAFAQSIRVAITTENIRHQHLMQKWRKRVEAIPISDAETWFHDVDDDHEMGHSLYRAVGVAVWEGAKLKVRFTVVDRDVESFESGADLVMIPQLASVIATLGNGVKGALLDSSPFVLPNLGERTVTLIEFRREGAERGVIFGILVAEDFLRPVETDMKRVNPDGTLGDGLVMKKFLPYVAEELVHVRHVSAAVYDQAQRVAALNTTFQMHSPTGDLRLLFTPGPKFGGGELVQRARWMLAAGLLIAAMLAALVWTQARQRGVLAAEVCARTAELENTRDELRTALHSERELVRMKSQFVNTVSHEFRTPLGVILSSADILTHYLDRLPAEDRTRHLRDIQDSSGQMSRMLEQVLDLGRIDADRFSYHPKPLDLALVLERIAAESRSAHGGEVRLCIVGALDGSVADEALLRHILLNLLSNARKYSAGGSVIELSANRDCGDAVLIVRDHGIGIPAQDLEHVFETFSRASNATGIPGTGLGLDIVKRCVALHRATIHLESLEGRGTTVTVRLPLFAGNRDRAES